MPMRRSGTTRRRTRARSRWWSPTGASGRAASSLASCNRIVHGLRALGLGKGDCRRGGAAERRGDDRAVPRRAQAGLYLMPINWHLDGARDRLHRAGLRGEGASSRTSASATPCTRRRDELGFPTERRFAVGDDRPASGRSPSSTAGQPDTPPRRARRRRGDELHVGHDRPAEGRAPRRCRRSTPTSSRRSAPASSRCSASSPRTATSTSAARRSTTPRCWSSRRRRCTSATPSC